MNRWVEDSKLQAVKFFELDETERVNVTRPPGSGSFSDLKRSDMRHEAEMLMARRSHHFDISDDYQSRVQTFSPWKLIPCDSQSNLIESGKESNEKFIQLERMKTTLESFYTRNQIPDSPQEPELELNLEIVETKTIPLEDENNPNNTHDFSNIDLPQPKTGEHLPSRIPDFKPPTAQMNNFTRIPGPFASSGGQPLLPVAPPNFSGVPSMMPQFGGPHMPAPDHYPVRPSNVQQFYPPSGGSMQQQWSDSCPPPHPPPPHFIPPFPNQIPQARGAGPMGPRPPRLPRNAQNTVCRHFARTGKCRFQPRCNFLHSNDKI
jgi:protein phosphatase 1 regulatory subunit 10